MALRTVSVIVSGGGDYTSLAACITGEAGNLVTLDRQLVINCSGGNDDNPVSFSNAQFTTDETHGVTINGSSDYTLRSTNAVALTIAVGYVIVNDLNIEVLGMNANYQGCIAQGAIGSGTVNEFNRCRLKAYPSTTLRHRTFSITLSTAARTCIVRNCLIWNALPNNASIANSQMFIESGAVYLYNNTIVGAYNSVYATGGTTYARNNIFIPSNAVAGTWAAGSNYNSTTKATATGGANDRVNQTFTFTNESTGDFSLTSGDTGAKDAGENLSAVTYGFSDDILSATRSDPWSIGAWEFITGGTYSGIFKRWNGSAWVKEILKYYTGSAWAEKPLKRWNGSAWVVVDTTGV